MSKLNIYDLSAVSKEWKKIKREQRKADKEAQEMYDKVKLTKLVLNNTKDFGIEKPLEGYDLILSKFVETASDIWSLGDFVDYLKKHYKTPEKL